MRRLILVASFLVCLGHVQAQSASVTVVTAKSTVSLTDAKILIDTGGRTGYLDMGGIYVTDAIIPPEGIQIKKVLLPWKDVRKIEFLEWGSHEPSRKQFTRAKITNGAGATKEHFLWISYGRDMFSFMPPTGIRITGKLSLEGTQQDVELTPQDLKTLEFAPVAPTKP